MRDKMFYWKKFCNLQRYSFILNSSGGVARWANKSGGWNDHYEMSRLVDEMEDEINRLNDVIDKSHVGVDYSGHHYHEIRGE